jgi:putative membrane protein
MGFGFVVARFAIFLREVTATTGAAPTEAGFSRWFGVALIAVGVALTAGSTAQHVLVLRRLARGEGVEPRPTWLALALAGFLVAIGVVATVYLATHGS